jgi:RNA polymerase sigma factor (sigma-70 family)
VDEERVGTGAVAQATAPQDVSDGALVAAVRAGEDAAFEELYRRYSRRIGSFVYGYVRDEGRAEDVTQEAFLSALRRMRETDSEIAFRPWIYEIARNAAIDLHRRTSRTEEISINGDTPLNPADSRRLVGSVGPENALVDKERLEHLSGAFAELSETHHRILVLRELEGLSYREIAERMALTAPAVESTLFRARRRLEHEYSELDTGRRCASMRSIIARLAEGVELPRERHKLERHAIRCSRCRRRARELGVEPMPGARLVSRAAALLPLPALLRRRIASLSETAGPAADGTGALIGKAGALLAAAALAGGGGATLGGYGPLAPRSGEPAVTESAPATEKRAANMRGAVLKARKRARAAAGATRERGSRRNRAAAGSGSVRGNGAAGGQPAAPKAEPPAPPSLPPVEQGVPPLPPLQESSTSGSLAPQVEVIETPTLPEAPPEPAAAIDPTGGAAVSSLPPIG